MCVCVCVCVCAGVGGGGGVTVAAACSVFESEAQKLIPLVLGVPEEALHVVCGLCKSG